MPHLLGRYQLQPEMFLVVSPRSVGAVGGNPRHTCVCVYVTRLGTQENRAWAQLWGLLAAALSLGHVAGDRAHVSSAAFT